MRLRSICIILLAGSLGFDAAGARASFFAFESGPVRPLALSPDGARLFAVNTPDNRLEVFEVSAGGLTHTASVPVGLEPVAVATRSDDEVWVVNHLSDSLSVIDLSGAAPRVVRTLLVGDEPRDIAVARGPFGERVLVTTARRGQNAQNHSTDPVDPLLTTEGVGRALVWIFDPANLGANLEGDPLAVVTLFGDTPRALAVSSDGSRFYAAVFHSGNRTTAITEEAVCNGGAGAAPCSVGGNLVPGGLPAPNANADGEAGPETGLIVKHDPVSGAWEDELGRDWSPAVRFELPDLDVFEVSTTTGDVLDAFPGVGTILFDMVANPQTGKLYVSNTEAFNEVRFEGPGTLAALHKPAGEPTTVQGRLHAARITILDGSDVTTRHLNPHIDYAARPAPAGIAERSLATPTGMAVSPDGATLYVAALGSGRVGVFDTAELESGTFTPDAADHIEVGGGPAGLVLDETGTRLYVLNRFDQTISIVDPVAGSELDVVALHNPEPAHVVEGRPLLYDARATSSNGEASCSACHVFGDLDSLAWDLGNPDDVVTTNALPLTNPVPDLGFKDFHPMKGPMTTQTLRGLANHGAMHWRGDRSVGELGVDPTDEVTSFNNFIVAFEGLLGREEPIEEAEMQKFTDFALDLFLPPNPIRALDNTLDADGASGRTVFSLPGTDSDVASCNDCHTLSPADGFFGADGGRSFEAEPQQFKVSHLRNAYQKVGMFGMPSVPAIGGSDVPTGEQIRGFGMLHDGSVDTIFRFLSAAVFFLSNTERRQLESFILQFDSDLAPIVGQQITLGGDSAAAVGARIDLLIERAGTPFAMLGRPGAHECDLVAKGNLAGEDRGWLFVPGVDEFASDRQSEPQLTDAQLRALASEPGQELTYTCVPPGSGTRIALDRDRDGFRDQDEEDAGSDPADPESIPAPTLASGISARKLSIRDKPDDDERKRKIVLLSRDATAPLPAPQSLGDPQCNGAAPGTSKVQLLVSSASSGEVHSTRLPCQNWKALGRPEAPKGYRYKDKELDDGTVRSALWKEGRLKLQLRGKGPSSLDYDLVDTVSQGDVALRFDHEGGGLCLRCTPLAGKDGSDGRKFLAKDCAAPVGCGS